MVSGPVVSYDYDEQLTQVVSPTTGTSSFTYDGLGSTRQLSNDSQSVVQTPTYDAFGNPDKSGKAARAAAATPTDMPGNGAIATMATTG